MKTINNILNSTLVKLIAVLIGASVVVGCQTNPTMDDLVNQTVQSKLKAGQHVVDYGNFKVIENNQKQYKIGCLK